MPARRHHAGLGSWRSTSTTCSPGSTATPTFAEALRGLRLFDDRQLAEVIAAQARCSFHPVSGADVTSKWVGGSEGNIRRHFERARENRPSVVFIDETSTMRSRA